MTKKEEMIFEQNILGITNIQCVSFGQPRAYADSLFKWNITTNTKVDRNELLKFCQKFLGIIQIPMRIGKSYKAKVP